jgi:hypothetical protein
MKFELELRKQNIPDNDIIQDIEDVAKRTERNTVTTAEYESLGKYSIGTFQGRFGSWFDALVFRFLFTATIV